MADIKQDFRPWQSLAMKKAWSRRRTRNRYMKVLTKPKTKKFLKAAVKNGSKTFRKLWGTAKFRKKISKSVSESNTARWKKRDYRLEMEAVLRRAKRARRHGYKKAFPIFRETLSNSMSRTVKRLRKDPEYLEMVMRSHVRISKPQISILKSLCARGFSGMSMEYFVAPYSIDIAFPKRKVAIEVNGKYWHKDRNRKRRRDRFLRHLGWKVIHVLAKLSSTPNLVEKLEKFL